VAAAALLLTVPITAGLGQSSGPTAGIDPALAARLTGSETLDAFVTFDHATGPADVAALSALGLQVQSVYPEFQLAYVLGTPAQLLKATHVPGAVWLQGNDPLQYHGNTGAVATRARESWDAKSTSATPVVVGGAVVDGRGTTVAVVDSGVDGTHPDLAPAMLANVKYVCTTPGLVNTATNTCYGNALLFGTTCTSTGWVALPNTDSSSGHGTHVAGIVAGRGTASQGRIMGNAPGAGIVGVGVGEGLSILFAVEAFKWVLCNAPTYGIDVVQNSWGGTGAFVASDPVNMAVGALVGAGMTVVFSAGNDGTAAGANQVNRYAKNPLGGVIGVGSSFDNEQARSTTATVSSYSSTCLATGAAVDCPDIGAPGEWISSAQGKTGPAVLALGAGGELNHLPYYSSISGTSMAAPAVSGVLALIEQAVPGMTPAAQEALLKGTAVDMPALAFPVTDPACTATGGRNTALGCGHIDAIAALEAALATPGLGSFLPALAQNPHVYVGVAGAGADGQFVSGIQWTVPAGSAVTLSERTIAGETPLAVGQACQFVVIGPVPATVPCAAAGAGLAADPLPGPPYRMDAAHTFPVAGTYVVEPQILFGATYVAFDHFQVTAV
jgi:serine protease AprX